MEDGVMMRLSRLIGLCHTATLDEVMVLLDVEHRRPHLQIGAPSISRPVKFEAAVLLQAVTGISVRFEHDGRMWGLTSAPLPAPAPKPKLPPKMNWCPNGYSSDYEATVRDMGDHVVLEARYLCIRETMFVMLERAYEAFGKRAVMFFNGEKYEWGAATTLTDLREQQSRGLRAARLRG